MLYTVIDLETTSKECYGRKGNPFYNSILCSGYKYQGKDVPISLAKDYIPAGEFNKTDMLIGHNIKYDLLYMWKNEELQQSFKRGLRIWDTQLVQYILSAQQHKYPALRDIAVNLYGCKERIKHIQQGFDQGLDTSQIDINLLTADVENDVMDTEAVATQQARLVKKKGMMPLVKAQMDAILCTTEMEFNGMYINTDILNANKQQMLDQLEQCKFNFAMFIADTNWPSDLNFNSSSNQHLSLLFFGGPLSYEVRNEVGKYVTGAKIGQARYKVEKKEIQINGLGIVPRSAWRAAKQGFFQTNEAVLKQIKHDAASVLLEIRYLNKQIDTYYTATEKYIHPFDSCVHAQLSHCGYSRGTEDDFGGGTNTGRLSARNPNIQNQPRAGDSLVKKHFTSRFTDGKIVEFDYKMLEVVVFAYLTQDHLLIKDINNSVDVYVETAKAVYDTQEVSDQQRQTVKRAVLAIIYGAGARKIAITLQIEEDEAKNIIEVFYAKYPQTREWQDRLVRIVNENNGLYRSCTGREYRFELKDSPQFLQDKGIMKSYNPADIKNYPVQGLATADIVLMMLGRLWRASLEHRDKFLLINTVHDSIVVDCKKEYLNFTCNFVKNELESVKDAMKEVFGLDFNLKIGVDMKAGDNWYDLDKVDLTEPTNNLITTR